MCLYEEHVLTPWKHALLGHARLLLLYVRYSSTKQLSTA